MPIQAWCEAFLACHAITSQGVWQTAWPDGKAYWEQDALIVALFRILHDELMKELKSSAEQ